MNLIIRSESVLLAYARKRLEQLTQKLARYQTEEQKRLENSLKIQREEDAKLTELKLKQEAGRMVSEFETTLKKKVRNDYEKIIIKLLSLKMTNQCGLNFKFIFFFAATKSCSVLQHSLYLWMKMGCLYVAVTIT